MGYSGGLDSTVLLHLLAGLRGAFSFQLSAVHVHHGLSVHADDWAAHCLKRCAELDIPLRVARVRVDLAGQGPEAAAREARYRVFAELAADTLALAHQRDDQAETVLLQLLRGGGLKGLAAMPWERALGHVRVLRPLLDASREEIGAYAHKQGLIWVDDDSNVDPALRRNAARHHLLPVLEAWFPGASITLARAAGQFAESARLLDTLAELDGADAPEGLDLAYLARMDEARARNLLRHYLESRGVPVQRERLHEALAQMLAARGDAEPRVDFGAYSLRRFQGRVVLVAPLPAPRERLWPWQGEAELELGASGRLIFARMTGRGLRLPERATVRLRAGGERLRPDARRPTRSLKNLLREAAVPPWLREHLPLLYVNDRLAWAAEVGADAAFQVGPEETGWLISWQKPG